MARNEGIVSVIARLIMITALLVPFCSFSTVVSPDASAQTEQEGAVEQLSVEKMIHYPDVIDQLYQSTNYRLNWENETDVDQLIFQIELVALADVTSEFDDQLRRIEQVREQGDELDFDLVMSDSLLMYLSYLEQVPQTEAHLESKCLRSSLAVGNTGSRNKGIEHKNNYHLTD